MSADRVDGGKSLARSDPLGQTQQPMAQGFLLGGLGRRSSAAFRIEADHLRRHATKVEWRDGEPTRQFV
jgi:hypothetical protein